MIHLVYNDNRHPSAMTDVFSKLCTKALERGWTFEMVAPEITRGSAWARHLTEQGARVHHLPVVDRRQTTERILELLQAEDVPAVVHTHLTGYDVPAALAARRHGASSVFWHVHSFLPTGLKPALRLRLKWLLFRGTVDRMVAQSTNIRDGLLAAGVPADRIVMFSSGINPEHYPQRTEAQYAEQRAAHGVSGPRKVLLHFGWDFDVKGTDRVLAAVKLLRDSGAELTVLINRGGAEAIAEIERLGLGDVARISPLVEETWPLYAACDCMVTPSRGEGMPFSVVEALATGLPVVASELPGHRYLADHIPSCTVVDPEPEKLAAAIEATLARPPEQAAREAAEGRAWILENLTSERVVDGLLADYDRALAERGLTV